MLNTKGKVLRIGGNPNNPKDYETCTVTDHTCPRHVHIERIKKTKATDVIEIEETQDDAMSVFSDNNDLSSKERIDGLMKAIEDGVQNVIDSGDMEKLLGHMSKFHRYSFGNQMLIYIQKPESTEVAGYNKWEEMGRQVKKGERGIEILAPVFIKKKKEEDDGTIKEETYTRFRSVRVFDISQTEPALYEFGSQAELDSFKKEWEDKGYEVTLDNSKPFAAKITASPKGGTKLLEGQAPVAMKSFVLNKIESEGIEIQYGNVGGGANGASWKDPQSGAVRISVRDDVSEAQQVKTLTHELMHVRLGHLDRMDEYHTSGGGHRGEMEVAVEALSFMVGNHFGLDTSDYSHGYMAGWAKSNKDRLKQVLENDVVPFFKDFLGELPENEHPPMGTSAAKRRAFKEANKGKSKSSWRSKKR